MRGGRDEIRLARSTLRPFRPGDEASLARHADNRRVWRNLRDRFPHPYTLADARAWVVLNLRRRPVTSYAIVVDGQVVGGIGLELQADVHSSSAEIGYWLGEGYWGRGIATEAVKAVTERAFSRLGLWRVYACVFQWNPASRRVLEKAGYRLEGRLRKSVTKCGRLMDCFLYARVRRARRRHSAGSMKPRKRPSQ